LAHDGSLPEHIPGIGDVPLIGILRKLPSDRVAAIGAVLQRAGLRVVEVTLDSDRPFDQIERLREATPSLTVGAGTVTSPDQVEQAVDSGAQFIVSPIMSSSVLATCKASGVPCLPGAATPTEIYDALYAGATAVKVFPAAQLGGPAYLRAIRSPLGDPPLVPTGGITLENAAEYLAAGAGALGVGSNLFPSTTSTEDELVAHVAEWIATVSG
jgi:2-dehydro-3-deoxyphosphogluconate aldolase / (4S)-4-hydroxy-2-oxoglutarate aldolase